MTLRYRARGEAKVSLHLGSPGGELVGEVTVKESDWAEVESNIRTTAGAHHLYFMVEGGVALDWIRFGKEENLIDLLKLPD